MLDQQASRQSISSRTSLILLASVLGAITSIVLAATRLPSVDSGLRVALFVIAGMLLMAVMTTLQELFILISPNRDNDVIRYLARAEPGRYEHFPLDAEKMLPVLEAEFVELRNQPVESKEGAVPSWGITMKELVHRDRNLALARLRMDLENELRRIAVGLELDQRPAYKSPTLIADELSERGALPKTLVRILRDVLTVSNEAVHGREVSYSQALATVDIGEVLLEILRRLPQNSVSGWPPRQ